MRAPPPPGRASVAGPVLHLLGPCSSPGGSSLMLAPVAQVSRSPLWLKSLARPCGSSPSVAPVAQVSRPPQVALLWPASGSAQLPLAMGVSRAACWCAGSPARITTVVLVGCAVGRARAGAAVRRSPSASCISGARRRSEPALSCARIAGPSHCGGSPAPRGCASLGVTGLCAATQTPSAWHHCGCSLGQAWHTGPRARARVVPGPTNTVRVSRSPVHRTLRATALPPFATSPGQRPPPLRQDLADSDGARGAGSFGPGQPDLAATTTRGHDTPRPDP